MRNTLPMHQQISLFRSQIHNRRFDDGTVRILESLLVSKDVESLIGVRSALEQYMKDESVFIFREIAGESIDIKLLCTDFLVRVFALIGDVESCLALRYEALMMRDQNTVTYPTLQVSSKEWITFAEQSLENGFYHIADKACDKAVMCCESKYIADSGPDESVQDMHTISKVKRLKDAALQSISSNAVRAQAATYMKQKEVSMSMQWSINGERPSSGSSRYRNGIKKHNLRRLHDHQRLCPSESNMQN